MTTKNRYLILIPLLALAMVNCKKKGSDDPTPSPADTTKTPVDTATDVRAWNTTPDVSGGRLSKYTLKIRFKTEVINAADEILEVNPATQYQTIDGFGAAITGSTAYLLQRKMTSAQRTALLTELFTTQGTGLGFNYGRVTIGSSDFSIGNYTYDDIPGGQTDDNMTSFSIEKDRADLFPTLKEVMALNPGFKLMGTPWSPPAWMKSTQSMIKGKLNQTAYPALARYFVKYVQAFGAEGIPIEAVSVQNEPMFEPDGYPGMNMTANEQAQFIGSHLGPAFAANSISAKIILYDHNWDHPEYPLSILADATARGYSAGSGFHGYLGQVSAMGSVHNAYPDKGVY